MSPLQTKVSELIAEYEQRHNCRVSGRELSERLGKSRNHLSQILNDGLVPSGEVLMKLADVLEAPEVDREELIVAAIRTKASIRSRDSFWLQQALELTDTVTERMAEMARFLEEQGRGEEFRRWLESRDLDGDTASEEGSTGSGDGSADAAGA